MLHVKYLGPKVLEKKNSEDHLLQFYEKRPLPGGVSYARMPTFGRYNRKSLKVSVTSNRPNDTKKPIGTIVDLRVFGM